MRLMLEQATTLHVLLLSDLDTTAAALASILAAEAGVHVRTARAAFGEGLDAVARFEPHVIVVADTLENLPATVQALDAAAPDIPALAIVPEDDVHAAQACTLGGARAALVQPVEPEALLTAVRHVYARDLQRRRRLVASVEAGLDRPQRPRIIAVHGAKGGVGATTLACNLAACLRKVTGRRLALIDGDVLGGDVGVLLGLVADRSLTDLLPAIKDLDEDGVNHVLVPHSAGFRVALAPEQLQRAEQIGGEDVQRALIALKTHFDYQIVDTAAQIGPVGLAVMDEADLIVLVVTPEIMAIRSAARFLHLAAQLGYPPEKILLLANRANTGKDITPAVLETHLHTAVAAALPSDGGALVACQNAGELLALSRPRHPVSDGLYRLARQIAARYAGMPAGAAVRAAAGTSRGDRLLTRADPGPAVAGGEGRDGRALPLLARAWGMVGSLTRRHAAPAGHLPPERRDTPSPASPEATPAAPASTHPVSAQPATV